MSEKTRNTVILLGRLGRDAETKFTSGGTAVSNFSIATTRRWKEKNSDEWKEETDWTNCVLWRSENLSQYLTKGTRLEVEGRLQTRSYEKDGVKKYVTEVIVEDVILLGAPGEKSASGADASQPRGAGKAKAPVDLTDDDVPF